MMTVRLFAVSFGSSGFLIVLCFLIAGFAEPPAAPYLIVLGIAQDAGAPQAGCRKICCRERWNDPRLHRRVSCLAIVDPATSEHWLIDATPDFKTQLHTLDEIAPAARLSGIFLTHGHIGHYTGLMQLGREAMGAPEVSVFAMPRLREFLSRNGPWEQLVRLKNIVLRPMQNDSSIVLNNRIRITPFLVPHRDEYSETVGFHLSGPNKTVLFIPDIDKWEKWERRIEEMIGKAEVAYVDGTFYADGEIPGRNMKEIPHPFIMETMVRLAAMPATEKSKVRFIHLNHTNPALRPESPAAHAIEQSGFRIAMEGERVAL
jgi:pyrroloquinoline quinone biosynthesis protein B